MPLTEVKIKSAKPGEKRYQIADSDGLYIEIMTSGKKYWFCKKTMNILTLCFQHTQGRVSIPRMRRRDAIGKTDIR